MKCLQYIPISTPFLLGTIFPHGAELEEAKVAGQLDNLVGSAMSASMGVVSGEEGSAAISTVRELDDRKFALGYDKYGYDRLLLTGSLNNQGGRIIYGLETRGYDGAWSDIDENIEKKNLWL